MNRRKLVILATVSLICLGLGVEAYAATSGTTTGTAIGGTGVSGLASNVRGQLSGVAKLITAIAYVSGMAFCVGAIVKFKAHKDNPTQVPIGLPIALLFIGAALLVTPNVFKTAATTLYQSGTIAGTSGVSSFTNVK